MPLKIVRATDPVLVRNINLCIYAAPGLGKTSLGFTAEDPLLLDFDKGIHRAAIRKDSVPISSWEDAATIAAEDLANYKTIVVDTAGRALDFLGADIMKSDPKARNGESLSLKGFGILKGRFGTWMRGLNMMGKDVVLVAHMEEKQSGDDVIERLDIQGASKAEIYKSADAMGRIRFEGRGLVIDFSPKANAFAKNPCSLEIFSYPDPALHPATLAEIIAKIKHGINQKSAEQIAAQEATQKWVEAINDYTTVDDFNRVLAQLHEASAAAKRHAHDRAKSLGFVWDKASLLYTVPAPAVPPEVQAVPEAQAIPLRQAQPLEDLFGVYE